MASKRKKWSRDFEPNITPDQFYWLISQNRERSQEALLNLQIYGVLK